MNTEVSELSISSKIHNFMITCATILAHSTTATHSLIVTQLLYNFLLDYL